MHLGQPALSLPQRGVTLVSLTDGSPDMTTTTSIKLPPELKERVAAVARKTGRTPHSLIVEAVERHTFYEERMQEFIAEALLAAEEIDATGEVYALEDVSAWSEKLVQGKKVPRLKPCRK